MSSIEFEKKCETHLSFVTFFSNDNAVKKAHDKSLVAKFAATFRKFNTCIVQYLKVYQNVPLKKYLPQNEHT